MKKPDTIFTAAFGFRDNDAYGHVWGRTPKYCEAFLAKAINDAAKANWDPSHKDWEGRSERLYEVKEKMWAVGPFPTAVAEVELEEKGRADEFADDLVANTAGYLY